MIGIWRILRINWEIIKSMFDSSKISTEELASELIKRSDLFNENGFLSTNQLYDLRCKLGVVICVDSVPIRKLNDGSIEIMAIRRKTGPYAGKLCLVGGILKKGYSVEESVRQHFKIDLGVEIDFITPWDRPVCLHQDMRPLPDGSLKTDFAPDPTKDHVIAPVYLVKFRSEAFKFGVTPHGGQEVAGTVWFSLKNMPPSSEFGYDHDLVFKKCLSKKWL